MRMIHANMMIFLICVFSIIILPFYGRAQPYNSVRICYVNTNQCTNSAGIPDIPEHIIQRAKNNGYTHVLAEFYLAASYYIASPNPTWQNGEYYGEQGIPHSYHNGRLYSILRSCFEKVGSAGLTMIPYFGVGGPYLSWSPTDNPNLEYYKDVFGGAGDIASIAPGQTTGFKKTVTEIMRVIQASHADARITVPSINSQLPYIGIGYTEASHSKPNARGKYDILFGTSNLEKDWLIHRPGSEVGDIIVASWNEIAEITRTDVGGSLNNTQLIVCADMFDPEFHQSSLFENYPLPSVVDKAKAEGLDDKMVFWQWNYKLLANDGTTPYNYENSLSFFAKKGFRVVNTASICTYDNLMDVPDQMPALVASVKASFALSTTQYRDNIIGYVSGNWAIKPTDLVWNTIEYMAYGNQKVRPLIGTIKIPKGSFSGAFIPSLIMDETEVTQADYYAVTGNFPFNNFSQGNPSYPAENVTWYDAILYCNARSLKEGLKPVYSYNTTSKPPHIVKVNTKYNQPLFEFCDALYDIAQDTSKNGYRLPSANEWEYAYRAGTTTDYFWGSAFNVDYLWYSGNSSATMPVKKKLPNNWGLYDMAGNVEEWTWPTSGNPELEGGGYTLPNINNYFKWYGGHTLTGKGIRAPYIGFRVVRKAPPDLTPILDLLLN